MSGPTAFLTFILLSSLLTCCLVKDREELGCVMGIGSSGVGWSDQGADARSNLLKKAFKWFAHRGSPSGCLLDSLNPEMVFKPLQTPPTL